MQKEIVVSLKVYPLEVVYAAAYVFIDRCYVFLDKREGDAVAIRLRAQPDVPKKEFDKVVGGFENELLNQALRLKITKQTARTRDAIIHRALFSAMPESLNLNLVDEQPADYLDDPLGIAVPWEEKFGEKKEGAPSGDAAAKKETQE
jgi:His-Xaa-Ser system protein HxsD